jgi:hypothetical protein
VRDGQSVLIDYDAQLGALQFAPVEEAVSTES